MMINVIAAQPGTVPIGAASAETAENVDFAGVLINQIAAVTDSLAPVTQATPEQEASDEVNTEEADAAALLLTNAAVAPLPSTVMAEAAVVAQPAALDLNKADVASQTLPLNRDADTQRLFASDAAQNLRRSPADEMLRMIARPQAAHHSAKPAEPQTQQLHEPAALIKPALNTVPMPTGENDNAVLPVENRSQTMPLTAAPAMPVVSQATAAAASPAAGAMQSIAYGMLEPEVGSPAWQQALSQKLSAFTRNGVHHAELRLHPEHLGPLQIKLRLEQDQVQLHFVTEQPPVRAALEAAMPHLRTSLAEAGIQMDQGSVGRDASAWNAPDDSHSGRSSSAQEETNGALITEMEEEIAPPRSYSPMGISVFA
ncbi:flagellar hook-length control protein FliK [Pantoea alhagi]|uniref:flagellar hook-length control protein FliK n=1 Tax=Mixta sp. BE291 TaxID=3158787 RepID=UPI0028610586|nr:flagellar hook-length control protein FliK [Pantoea alhagi]